MDGSQSTRHSAHAQPCEISPADLKRDGPNELLQLSASFDNETDGEEMVTAGDSGHGGANGRQVWVRNNSVHPLVPLTPVVADQSDGELERGGAVAHGQMKTAQGAPRRFIQASAQL